MYDQYITNPKQVRNICKVTQLTFYLEGNGAVYNISYDKKGNIVSMLTDNFAPGGRENIYFRYDSKNRLTDRLFVYVGNIGVVGWDSYIYFPDKIMDTSYYYGGIYTDTHPPYDAPNKKWAELKSDAFGRIIKETQYLPYTYPNPTDFYIFIINYNYDNNGNLIVEPLRTFQPYDDKINPFLTNPMWQLVNRNYSVNNATDYSPYNSRYPLITKYNAYGLPVKYVKPPYSNPVNVFGYECDSLEVTYDCDVPKANY
jgi:hypothetical protein